SGTIGESGNWHASDNWTTQYGIGGSGTWTASGGTGPGGGSGSTSWSYSGSGTYTDANAGSGISFYTPSSATVTITPNVSGTAYASGQLTGSTGGTWTTSLAAGASTWSYSGSGTGGCSISYDGSYPGSHSFPTRTLFRSSGTIGESGNWHASD